MHHDKTENITVLAAAEAVITLCFSINMKRRSLFLMKGTKPGKSRKTAPFQLYEIADKIGNFTAAADLFNNILIESGHKLEFFT